MHVTSTKIEAVTSALHREGFRASLSAPQRERLDLNSGPGHNPSQQAVLPGASPQESRP